MAERKKLGELIEVPLPFYGTTAVVRRQDESDEEWSAIKQRIKALPPGKAALRPAEQALRTAAMSADEMDPGVSPEPTPSDRFMQRDSSGGVSPSMVPSGKKQPSNKISPEVLARAEELQQAGVPLQDIPSPEEIQAQLAQPERQVPADQIKVSRSPTAGPLDHLKMSPEGDSSAMPAATVAPPEQPGVLQQVGEGVARNLGFGGVVDTVKGINENVVGPNRGPTDALREAGATVLGAGPGAQMADLQKGSAAQAPTSPSAAEATPVSTSSSMSVRTPGGGGSDLEAQANRVFGDEMKALKERSTLEAQQAREVEALELEKVESLSRAEEARAKRANEILAEQDRLLKAQEAVSAKLQESLKVDPRRLWNSRTAEQKSNAQLAAFFFGLAGQGMDYVKQLQAEVDRDVDLQVTEFNAKRDGVKAQLAAQQNLFSQYRNMGLDANMAATAAKENMLQVHQARLNALAQQYAGKTAGARAAEAASAIGQKRIELVNKLRTDASLRAERSAQMWAMQQKAAAGPAKKPMNAMLLKRIADKRDLVMKVRRMQQLAANTGVMDRAKAKVGETGIDSEQQAKTRAFESLKNDLAKAAASGAIQREEAERLLPLFGSRSQLLGDPVVGLKEMERSLQQQLNSDLETMRLYGEGVEGVGDAMTEEQILETPRE